MSYGELPIDDLLLRLRLPSTRALWRSTCDRARNEGWTYEEFLAVLLVQELNHQQADHTHHRLQLARLPFQKTIHEFDFEATPPDTAAQLGPCLERSFVTEGRTLVLIGAPGRGKTHLAVAVAYQALRNGFDALYVRGDELRADLERAAAQGHWRESIGRYTRPDVLVLDDVGEIDGAGGPLYQVIQERHIARRALIMTMVRPPERQVAARRGDAALALLLERLCERGQLVYLDPEPPESLRVTVDATPAGLASSRQALPGPTTLPPLSTPTDPSPPRERPAAAGPERRIHRRLSVSLEVNATSKHNFFTGFCQDISEGGLFLATHDLRPVGELIDLEFSLPDGHKVSTTGVVRWQRTCGVGEHEWPGIGLEFLALSPEDREAIRSFFLEREPLFFA
ncbi:MAG: ATP-binding protein [Polyangiaceae bacterium]|jgi:uncharacterized protein (TIGR02266 family)|nr:ATP-binding protein [Polyangiaceae bacterium]